MSAAGVLHRVTPATALTPHGRLIVALMDAGDAADSAAVQAPNLTRLEHNRLQALGMMLRAEARGLQSMEGSANHVRV